MHCNAGSTEEARRTVYIIPTATHATQTAVRLHCLLITLVMATVSRMTWLQKPAVNKHLEYTSASTNAVPTRPLSQLVRKRSWVQLQRHKYACRWQFHATAHDK